MAEHEVVVLPGFAGWEPFGGLALLVRPERFYGDRFGSTSERRDFGVLVSPPLLAERQTWMIP